MLVLGRRFRQEITIGPIPPGAVGKVIRVTVIESNRPDADIRLGIEADRDIPILRQEADAADFLPPGRLQS